MLPFKFKKQPRSTGLSRVANPHASTEIRIKTRNVGIIWPPSYPRGIEFWHIGLMVKTTDHPGWKWIRLKHDFKTEPEARQWAQENSERIQKTYDLYHQEP